MFDISFAELMVVAVVALLVIGPEKLPKVARTLGAFVGRAQRYVAQVKEEINREARFEELQKLQQEIGQSVNHVQSSMLEGRQSVMDAIKPPVNTQSTESAPRNSTLKKSTPRKPRAAKTVVEASQNTQRDNKPVVQPQQAKPDLASLIKNQHLKTVKSREKPKA